ncbi:unnamed protein product [Urochloa humidicola]
MLFLLRIVKSSLETLKEKSLSVASSGRFSLWLVREVVGVICICTDRILPPRSAISLVHVACKSRPSDQISTDKISAPAWAPSSSRHFRRWRWNRPLRRGSRKRAAALVAGPSDPDPRRWANSSPPGQASYLAQLRLLLLPLSSQQ